VNWHCTKRRRAGATTRDQAMRSADENIVAVTPGTR